METQIVKSKPRNVEQAIILMWILMGLSALSTVLNFSHLSSQTGVALALFTLGFSYAIAIFFYAKLAAGKNWARWTLLVFMVGGLLMSATTLPTEWSRSPLSVLLSLVMTALQIYILYLAFTPAASPWFHQNNDQPGLQNAVTVHTSTRSTTASQTAVDFDISTQVSPPVKRPKPAVDYSDRT
jgi:hypothetical protein